MPQAKRIRPRVHGAGHLKPGIGNEMGTWRPEEFADVRTQLADCEACQACLFVAEGEDTGHLHDEAVTAIAGDRINRRLPLIARHLRECAECAQAIFDAEGDDDTAVLEEPELDFEDPRFPPVEESEG